VAPAAAEVDPGAGAFGLGSKNSTLTKSFRPFSTEKRSTKLGGRRPSLRVGEGEWRPPLFRRGTGEWRPLLLKSTPGPRPLARLEKGALTKSFHPFSAEKRSTKLRGHRPSLRRGEGRWRLLLLKSTPGPGPLSSARKKRALTKSFRPFSAENRSTKLG